jgi:predicted lipid-binding transport protein (Tim44 family)
MGNILLGLVVIVIFRILFKKFGTLTKEEYNKKNEAIQNFVKQQQGGYLCPGCSTKPKKIKEISICSLKQIKKAEETESSKDEIKDPKGDFDEKLFLKTVETAISSIMDAFNAKNLKELEQFCMEDMFAIFKKNMESATAKNESYRTILVNFLEKEIVEKNLANNNGNNFVSLRLKTEQINYVEDKDGRVIFGSKDEIQQVEELWKFELIGTKDNVWALKSIKAVG